MDLIEDMFNNVNHLIECQAFVLERVQFLEGKRLELTNIIQNIGVSTHKETLLNQIKGMEMTLTINSVTDIIEKKLRSLTIPKRRNPNKNADIMTEGSAKVS